MDAKTPQDKVRDRLHGLDWFRAIAAILVVMLHAGIPYLRHPMPGLTWSTDSAQKSAFLDALCWAIDGFIMPSFFLMTGFFSARLLKQRGADRFLKHRLKRIGGPLLFALVVILPLDLYAWLLGWVNAGWIAPVKLRSLKIEGPLGEALWGVSHLWYLEYVLVYCLAAWCLSRSLSAIRSGTASTTLNMSSRLPLAYGPLALLGGTLLAGAILWHQPRVVIGFRHDWYPLLANLIYYAVPFGLGWIWESQARRKEPSHRFWVTRLLATIPLFALLWPRLQRHLEQETIPANDPWVPFLFAAFGLVMASSAFGLAHRLRFERVSPTVSYLAKASFWIYLFHHPLVGLVHADMALVSMAPEVEFLLTTLIVLGICLGTYEVAVRRTWIGQLLNGYRDPARVAPRKMPVPARTEDRRAA